MTPSERKIVKSGKHERIQKLLKGLIREPPPVVDWLTLGEAPKQLKVTRSTFAKSSSVTSCGVSNVEMAIPALDCNG
jgi:hypothetical protein